MPVKSWSFVHKGHPVRAEIWWRLTGWSRWRLYIDHRKVAGRRGWIFVGRPLVTEIDQPDGSKEKLQIRFQRGWAVLDINCLVALGTESFSKVRSARVYKKLQYHAEQGEQSENVFVQKVGCLLLMAFLLIMCVLYAPMVITALTIHQVQEKRRIIRMRKVGRFLRWPAIESRIRSSKTASTLILQIANLTPTRAWWTEDDLLTKSPLPLPVEIALSHPADHESRHPLTEWCQAKYFDEKTGRAWLTDLSDWDRDTRRLLDDVKKPGRLNSIYPQLNVVVVGFTSGARLAAAERFSGLLCDNSDKAIPGLVKGITDPDKAVRELCLESIQLTKSYTELAAPVLKTELYLAPPDEGYLIAKTLVEMGPVGLEILQAAATCQDSTICRSARSAISLIKIRARSNAASVGL